MASAGSIFVDLLLRDSGYRSGLNRASRATRQASQSWQGDLGRTKQAFGSVISPVNNLTGAVRQLGAVIATSLSVQKIVQYSDTWKQLSGRLSLVAGESSELIGTQQELFEIAQRTRQPLQGVYNLYTRLAQAIPEASRAQYDLLGVTESINQALAITGEGSAQASSAILQFTQAVASGFKGSGPEINALLDSAPRLAQALQRTFGDGKKSLKELAKDGELDLAKILKALSGAGKEGQKLREEFAKIPPTVGQAFTKLDNAFLKFIGQSKEVNSVTDLFSKGLVLLAENLDAVAKAAVYLGTVLLARVVVAFAASQASALAFQLILARMAGVSGITATALLSLGAAGRVANAALAFLGGPISAGVIALGTAFAYLATRQTQAERAAEFFAEKQKQIIDINTKLKFATEERTKELKKEREEVIKAAEAQIQLAQARLESFRNLPDPTKDRFGVSGRADAIKRRTAAILEQQEALKGLKQDIINFEKNQKNREEEESNTLSEDKLKKLQALYKKNETFITGLDRATLQYNETQKELAKLEKQGLINKDQLTDALRRLKVEYDEGREKIGLWGIDVSEVAKDAAKEVQGAFADFLFNPFEGGLKGMVKGFVDTVRRMIAEAQAAQLAKYLFGGPVSGATGETSSGLLGGLFSGLSGGGASAGGGGGGFLSGIGSLFGGFFAEGGYLPPGMWGIAGEEGAELITGGRSGKTIIPMDGMGGNTYNIDARGTDPSVVRRVEQALMALAGPGVVEKRTADAQVRGSL